MLNTCQALLNGLEAGVEVLCDKAANGNTTGFPLVSANNLSCVVGELIAKGQFFRLPSAKAQEVSVRGRKVLVGLDAVNEAKEAVSTGKMAKIFHKFAKRAKLIDNHAPERKK